MKKILITGVAGFIGFNLAKSLDDYEIFGIDNLNNYYDVNLKLSRLNYLKKNPKFNFLKIDICDDKDILEKYLSINKFDHVIHLAAQAGVRYSLENPISYINSNILGSVNLFETLKKEKFNGHLIVASTSSVYGLRNENDFLETDITDHQLSLYAASKKSLESISHSYSYNFNLKITLTRFFTVYGPWGRPDMALFKFTKNILNNEPIEVYNNGEMWRDFTYIDDLTKSLKLLISKPPMNNNYDNDSISKVAPYRIVNIGNQKNVKLLDVINLLEETINKKAIINFLPLQAGDVKYTLSNSNLLKKIIDYSPNTPISKGIENFYNWYKGYYLNSN